MVLPARASASASAARQPVAEAVSSKIGVLRVLRQTLLGPGSFPRNPPAVMCLFVHGDFSLSSIRAGGTRLGAGPRHPPTEIKITIKPGPLGALVFQECGDANLFLPLPASPPTS